MHGQKQLQLEDTVPSTLYCIVKEAYATWHTSKCMLMYPDAEARLHKAKACSTWHAGWLSSTSVQWIA